MSAYLSPIDCSMDREYDYSQFRGPPVWVVRLDDDDATPAQRKWLRDHGFNLRDGKWWIFDVSQADLTRWGGGDDNDMEVQP